MIRRFRGSAHAIKILLLVLICTAVTAGILVTISHYHKFQAQTGISESAPEIELPEELSTAYDAVIEQYRAALTLSSLDWQNNIETHMETYPLINSAYVGFYHIGMVNTLYAAYHDIDSNGTPELFIGIGDKRSAMEAGVYSFNGSEAVPLSRSDTSDGYQILSDGFFIQSDKGGIILTVKQISSDGCSLEDTETADLHPGASLQDINLAAHGDHLTLTNWQKVPLQ